MASSASGQDEPNRALWLATRAGKMEPSYLLGTTRCIPQAKLHQKPCTKSFIDQVCSVKMAEYWPRSFFASLLTSTSSRSINTQKKNLANIQPSWPHTWSITHTYCAVIWLAELWLAPQERHISRSRLPAVSRKKKKCSLSHVINPLLTKRVRSRLLAGYWPRSFFARVWTSTLPWSINMQQK